mgnify:FL=1
MNATFVGKQSSLHLTGQRGRSHSKTHLVASKCSREERILLRQEDKLKERMERHNFAVFFSNMWICQ